ncbi:hypothetical protein TCON_1193 [Astathelohania contejeani]|uniref:VPS37 C-terminal domain-containing protein n=1 Tax=Astathelohania contejeani TaxID=164912 RepID=A0ABQ7HZL6_9MICR|nr:hypothetical protein TCON_1193 [Thelohania contejeani]
MNTDIIIPLPSPINSFYDEQYPIKLLDPLFMITHGPRFTKLKQVYKKTIQEIVKSKQELKTTLDSPLPSDSFATVASSPSAPIISDQTLDEFYNELSERMTESFKQRIQLFELATKLDILDGQISSQRINLRDIRNEEYIREIFESHSVDKKMEFYKFMEQLAKESEERRNKLKSEIEDKKHKIKNQQKINDQHEERYKNLVDNLESVNAGLNN